MDSPVGREQWRRSEARSDGVRCCHACPTIVAVVGELRAKVRRKADLGAVSAGARDERPRDGHLELLARGAHHIRREGRLYKHEVDGDGGEDLVDQLKSLVELVWQILDPLVAVDELAVGRGLVALDVAERIDEHRDVVALGKVDDRMPSFASNPPDESLLKPRRQSHELGAALLLHQPHQDACQIDPLRQRHQHDCQYAKVRQRRTDNYGCKRKVARHGNDADRDSHQCHAKARGGRTRQRRPRVLEQHQRHTKQRHDGQERHAEHRRQRREVEAASCAHHERQHEKQRDRNVPCSRPRQPLVQHARDHPVVAERIKQPAECDDAGDDAAAQHDARIHHNEQLEECPTARHLSEQRQHVRSAQHGVHGHERQHEQHQRRLGDDGDQMQVAQRARKLARLDLSSYADAPVVGEHGVARSDPGDRAGDEQHGHGDEMKQKHAQRHAARVAHAQQTEQRQTDEQQYRDEAIVEMRVRRGGLAGDVCASGAGADGARGDGIEQRHGGRKYGDELGRDVGEVRVVARVARRERRGELAYDRTERVEQEARDEHRDGREHRRDGDDGGERVEDRARHGVARDRRRLPLTELNRLRGRGGRFRCGLRRRLARQLEKRDGAPSGKLPSAMDGHERMLSVCGKRGGGSIGVVVPASLEFATTKRAGPARVGGEGVILLRRGARATRAGGVVCFQIKGRCASGGEQIGGG
ncbi:hypothetical protein L1887_52110 [Cichorium endivia]|nr:hypothetical protein L1887_52110 [Cichorium endivia]